MNNTFGSEHCDSLETVRAQVMMRIDDIRGWVPVGEPGYSTVSLKRIYLPSHSETPHVQYIITGQKNIDQSIVLECVLNRDMHYEGAHPLFHHWLIDDERYGLTFERATDASMFNKSIKRAIAHLRGGYQQNNGDEVFMAIDLPLGRKSSSSQSASTASTTANSPTCLSPGYSDFTNSSSAYTDPNVINTCHSHLHRIPFISPNAAFRNGTSTPTTNHGILSSQPQEMKILPQEENAALTVGAKGSYRDYPYVVFTKDEPTSHAYVEPTSVAKQPSEGSSLEAVKLIPSAPLEYEQTPSPTVHTSEPQTPLLTLPPEARGSVTSEPSEALTSNVGYCQHCHQRYSLDTNAPGSCESCPSQRYITNCIGCVSCTRASSVVMYHCASDSEGNYEYPLSCSLPRESRCRHWTFSILLSIFLPCVCLFWPLVRCQQCCFKCGLCGGRHKNL